MELNTPTTNSIPETINHLLKLIYAHLGSPLLPKCLEGYTQNLNEALHSIFWKLYTCMSKGCGKESVDITCSIAMCRFNELFSLWIELTTSHFCRHVLRKRDRFHVHKLKYKSRECGRAFRRRAREAIEDRKKERGACICSCLGGLTVTQILANMLGQARDSCTVISMTLCVAFFGLFIKS